MLPYFVPFLLLLIFLHLVNLVGVWKTGHPPSELRLEMQKQLLVASLTCFQPFLPYSQTGFKLSLVELEFNWMNDMNDLSLLAQT